MTRERLIRKLRPILLRRRDAIRQSVAGELNHLNISDERTVGDSADAAIDHDYGLVNSHLAEVESRELVRIEHALDRIRRGEFGVCEECGQRIPAARLEALPYATTCVKCQRTVEWNGHSPRRTQNWSRVEDDRHNESKLADAHSVLAV